VQPLGCAFRHTRRRGSRFAVRGRGSDGARFERLTKLLVELEVNALPPGDYSLAVTFRDPCGRGAPAETRAGFRIL
jgi:hypothetical protein